MHLQRELMHPEANVPIVLECISCGRIWNLVRFTNLLRLPHKSFPQKNLGCHSEHLFLHFRRCSHAYFSYLLCRICTLTHAFGRSILCGACGPCISDGASMLTHAFGRSILNGAYRTVHPSLCRTEHIRLHLLLHLLRCIHACWTEHLFLHLIRCIHAYGTVYLHDCP